MKTRARSWHTMDLEFLGELGIFSSCAIAKAVLAHKLRVTWRWAETMQEDCLIVREVAA